MQAIDSPDLMSGKEADARQGDAEFNFTDITRAGCNYSEGIN